MALNKPHNFNKAPPAGFDGLFHWDYLGAAFGGSIMPIDFDAVIERNGHFLNFETKDSGVAIPKGQRIALERSVLTGYFTVFLLNGKTADAVTRLEIWQPDNDGIHRTVIDPCDADMVVASARRWFEFASRYPMDIALGRRI